MKPPGEEPENTDAAPIGADSAARVRDPGPYRDEPSGEEPEEGGRAGRCGLGALGKGPGPHRDEPSGEEPGRMRQSERLLALALSRSTFHGLFMVHPLR